MPRKLLEESSSKIIFPNPEMNRRAFLASLGALIPGGSLLTWYNHQGEPPASVNGFNPHSAFSAIWVPSDFSIVLNGTNYSGNFEYDESARTVKFQGALPPSVRSNDLINFVNNNHYIFKSGNVNLRRITGTSIDLLAIGEQVAQFNQFPYFIETTRAGGLNLAENNIAKGTSYFPISMNGLFASAACNAGILNPSRPDQSIITFNSPIGFKTLSRRKQGEISGFLNRALFPEVIYPLGLKLAGLKGYRMEDAQVIRYYGESLLGGTLALPDIKNLWHIYNRTDKTVDLNAHIESRNLIPWEDLSLSQQIDEKGGHDSAYWSLQVARRLLGNIPDTVILGPSFSNVTALDMSKTLREIGRFGHPEIKDSSSLIPHELDFREYLVRVLLSQGVNRVLSIRMPRIFNLGTYGYTVQEALNI